MAAEFDPQNHIVNSIIPRMQERRGRSEGLSAEQIIDKLEAARGTGKQGEFSELGEAIHGIDGVNGKLASEIADLVYYRLQINCPPEEKDQIDWWFNILGIPDKVALEFCIVKYELRIRCGDRSNHKEIENRALDIFINHNYPELKTLWKNPIAPSLS